MKTGTRLHCPWHGSHNAALGGIGIAGSARSTTTLIGSISGHATMIRGVGSALQLLPSRDKRLETGLRMGREEFGNRPLGAPFLIFSSRED